MRKYPFSEGLPLLHKKTVSVFTDHIDGTMSALLLDEKLTWLKATNVPQIHLGWELPIQFPTKICILNY